jgi:molecular chaperone Hsp33
MLASFTEDDIADMVEEGRVKVTCEFCKSLYEFAADELLGKNTTLQ